MSLQFSFDEEAHLWSFMVFPEREVETKELSMEMSTQQ
jgi:hypothetical protein